MRHVHRLAVADPVHADDRLNRLRLGEVQIEAVRVPAQHVLGDGGDDASRLLRGPDAGQPVAEVEQGGAQLCPRVLRGHEKRSPQDVRLSRPATGESGSGSGWGV